MVVQFDLDNKEAGGGGEGDISTNSTGSQKGVQFHGVAIRYFNRLLGDNPAARSGPPLGLDWKYNDLTREESPTDKEKGNTNTKNDTNDTEKPSSSPEGSENGNETEDSESHSENENNNNSSISSSSFPFAVIPMDEYERDAGRRRKRRMMEVFKLQEKSQRQIQKMERTLEKRGSMTNILRATEEEDKNNDDLIPEEQMRQLGAKWLKLQPVSAMKRESILLKETETTKREIDALKKELFKIRSSRQNTIAMIETGMDDWLAIAQLIKRRFGRLRTGISKEKEQELLWEQASEYFNDTSCHSQRDSINNDSIKSIILTDDSTRSIQSKYSQEVPQNETACQAA